MIFTVLFLFAGFALLTKGADVFVEGASLLALKFNISPIVVGLTVVSFGTSAPELVVNIMAAVQGNTGISFGNVIGSNIANVLLILGVAAMVRPLQAQRGTIRREIPFSLLAAIVLLLLCNDVFFSAGDNLLARNDGLLLLLFFFIFVVYIFGISKIGKNNLPDVNQSNVLNILFFIILGLTGLLFGGKLVVDNALVIARYLKLSDRIIGLSIVAIGTSLPELVTSAVAAYKNQVDIAIGNIVGSNIFNIFLILGITSVIKPLPFQFTQNIDLLVLVLASGVLFFCVFISHGHRISRRHALLFLCIYATYCFYLFI